MPHNLHRRAFRGAECLLCITLLAILGTGGSTPAWAQDDPSLVGQWSARQTWPDFAIHAHLLPTGKVAFWSDTAPFDVHLWDPASDTFSVVDGPGYIHYCTGHSFLANGRLLVAGGHVENHVGLPDASLFDPFTETWIPLPDMNNSRWYPTATTLPNGDVVVVLGDIDLATTNFEPQVWETAKNQWRDLTGAVTGSPGVLYPWLFVAPNGKIFIAGHGQPTKYLDTSGTGAWTFLANTIAADREYGSGVMYEPGKVLIVGGAQPPLATAEVIDLNLPSPAWRNVGSLSGPRRQLNATLLPDGTVLVTGGSSGNDFNLESAPVFHAELWDPATETWTTMASPPEPIYRGYHSVAFLLPDGRVVTAGGTRSDFSNAEIFSPPYLFRGPRPTIAAARSAVTYGQTFFVATPDAADVARVTWVRLSSVTHAFNMNQRFNELAFSPTEGGIEVTTPLSGSLAPPGHYLLFLLDADGVPSIGKMTRIDVATGLAPAAPLDLAATAVSGSRIDLNWTDNSDNEEGFLIERSLDGVSFLEVGEAAANATAFSDLGLNVNTTYYYRMRGYNLVGESVYSNPASDTTLAVPATPTDLAATAVSATQIDLAWTDNADDEETYRIERSPDGSAFTEIASVGANVTQYMNTGLASGVTYYYRVRGANVVGQGDYSNVASARTFAPLAEVSDTSISFGTQHLGTTSAPQSVTLTNAGEADLTLSGISATGDFSLTHDCPGSLAPAASCTIQITFSPTATGTRNGTLTIAHNAAGSPSTVSLSGSGTHFFLLVAAGSSTSITVTAGGTATYRLTIVPDGFQGSLSFTCTGAPPAAICTVSPNPVALNGTTPVDITVTVTTTARSLAVPFVRQLPPGWLAPMMLAGLLAWLAFQGLLLGQRRRRWAVGLAPPAAGLAAVLLVLLTVSCGGGGANSVPRPPSTPTSGTPPGSFTITLAGTSGNLTSSMNLTLTVN